jgi:hypothetical protein
MVIADRNTYWPFRSICFVKEPIEICITFQVPLILHLDVGSPYLAVQCSAIKCSDILRQSPLNCNWSQIDASVSIIIIIKWSHDVIFINNLINKMILKLDDLSPDQLMLAIKYSEGTSSKARKQNRRKTHTKYSLTIHFISDDGTIKLVLNLHKLL